MKKRNQRKPSADRTRGRPAKSSLQARVLLVVGATLLTLGCSGGPERPVVQYVEGVVTLDGEPLAAANVTFVPRVSGVELVASGLTDEQGKYRLTSLRGGRIGAGAVAGEYGVSIDKLIDTRKDPGGLPPKPGDIVQAVPEAYTNPSTSGIEVTVRQGRNRGGEFDFHLTKEFTGAGSGRR
jgi:hypothetical protein